MPHPAWFIVAFAITLIGITKSGFGAGLGLIIVPLTALALAHLPPTEAAALGLLLPLLIAGDLVAIFQYRKLLDPTLLKRLALPTLAGLIVGSLALYFIHLISARSAQLAATLIRLELGFESLLLVSLHYYALWRRQDRKLLPEPFRSWLSGTYAAISSTLAHAAGPVIALYLLPLKLPREVFVGTVAAYFAALNTAKLPAFYAAGQFSYVSLSFTLCFLPLVFLGAFIGRWLVKKINDKLFAHLVYSTTFVMGLYLLISATLSLFKLSFHS